MATTLANIQSRLQAHGYGSDTDAAAAQVLIINSVYRRVLNTQRWEFMRKSAFAATVASTSTYAITRWASDVVYVDAIRLEIGTEFYDLEYLEPTEFRNRKHIYRDNAVPEYWTRFGNDIQLWPTPDRAYTMTMDYIHDPADLSAGGDVLVIPDAHADIVMWGSIMGIAYRERDWDGHNFARQMYAELLLEMQNEYGMANRQTTARVVDSGFFDAYDVDSQWLT